MNKNELIKALIETRQIDIPIIVEVNRWDDNHENAEVSYINIHDVELSNGNIHIVCHVN